MASKRVRNRSDDTDAEESGVLSSGRRRFLTGMALATVGASGVPLLPSVGQEEGGIVAKTPSSCSDVATPMKEVEGKVAFITGGSSGIGLGIAQAFADAGMKVVIGYRTQAHLEEAMKHLEKAKDCVHAIRVDVTDRPGMEKAAAETIQVFGKVHVLVNNAGVIAPAPLSRTNYEDWDWLMSVNLNGVFNGVQAFLPRIQAHGEGGQVVSISSVLGLFVVGGGQGAYCASKFAVVGMMEALRAELADTHIGVSVCCPGVVKSNLIDSNRNRSGDQAIGPSKLDPKVSAAMELVKSSPIPTDPLEVGQLVLRGMRHNDLYILTHPEFEPLIQHRTEVLMASVPRDVRPTDARFAMARSMLQDSIYTTERDRKVCARSVRK